MRAREHPFSEGRWSIAASCAGVAVVPRDCARLASDRHVCEPPLDRMRAEPQEPLGAGAPVNDAPGLRSEDPIELHHRRGRRTEERCDELAELLGCNSLEADVASQAGGAQ